MYQNKRDVAALGFSALYRGLAKRENHLSVIMDPCQALMTVHTMTNK